MLKTLKNMFKQDKYVTVSVCKKNIEEARNYFARVGADLIAHFNRLGSKCVELEAEEKLLIFHDFYRIGEETAFHFDIAQTMRTHADGYPCTYRKQWREDKINVAVEEVIYKLVNKSKFKTEIQKHIGQSIDTQELEREHTRLQERLNQVIGAKNKLASQRDNLSVSDRHYNKKYEDMQVRLDKLYDEIEEIETLIEEVESRLYNKLLF